MKNIINYMGHEFILKHPPAPAPNYGEFTCKICGLDAAMKFVYYTWHARIWDILDVTCDDMIIKKLLE